MKRQELNALLHGVENKGEIIDQIMELNGADIENAKKSAGGGSDALGREIERLKGENSDLTAQLKAYEKGGAKFIDAAEFERLKKFETDTQAKQKREKQTAAVKTLLKKNNAREDMLDLLLNGVVMDGVEVADDGTVKEGDKLVASLKEKYGAGFSPEAKGAGGAPFNPPPAGGGEGEGFQFGFTPVRPMPQKN